MSYITLEVNKDIDLQIAQKFLNQLKFVRRVIPQSEYFVLNLTDKELLKESMMISEKTLSEEWENPIEDEIWNDYLKSKLNEKI